RRFSRKRFVLTTTVALLVLGALGLAATSAARTAGSSEEYYQALKGSPEKGQGFETFGPEAEQCVHFEPEGLRLTLPAGHAGERPEHGLSTGLTLHGDFDVTVHFEI